MPLVEYTPVGLWGFEEAFRSKPFNYQKDLEKTNV